MKDFQFWKKEVLVKSKKLLQKFHVAVYAMGVILLPVCLFLLSYVVRATAFHLAVKKDPFPIVKAADYPMLQRVFSPLITAQAAYIMEANSKIVLFKKNDTVRFSPASTTKIMTALVALDYYKMNDMLTIRRSGVIPVVVGFPQGAKVSFKDMLYAMLLPSGNDAAYAIGDNYPGGEKAFVAAMNAKAKLLHLDNTHFGDPVGLVDDEDYTTVRDMSILSVYAMNHPVLAKIVGTKEAIITDSFGNSYDVKNLNKLLGLYGVNGVKTGYTGEAGEVLVTSAVIRNHTYSIVVLKSQDRFADTEKLLQLLTDNVSFVPIRP